jgi:hypothetical protein
VSIAREFGRGKAMEVRSSIRYEALGVFSQPEVMERVRSAGITIERQESRPGEPPSGIPAYICVY